MKKLVLVVVSVILMLSLSGCNMGVGFGSYTYNHVHIFDYSSGVSHATIEKWYDSESGIEVKTEEYGSIFLCEGTYILYKDKCPLCDKSE